MNRQSLYKKQLFQPKEQEKEIYAALDLGTNNCRLLIAEKNDGHFNVLDSFSRIVRLGEGISQNHLISDKAIRRTITALRICQSKIASYPIKKFFGVITEVGRRTDNCDFFMKLVKKRVGMDLELISAEKESYLSVNACRDIINEEKPYGLVIDVGGGSTELSLAHYNVLTGNIDIIGFTSLPYGVVTLTEEHGEIMSEVKLEKIREDIAKFEKKYKIQDLVEKQKIRFIGNSGTVTTLAGIHLKLKRYNRAKIDGYLLTRENYKKAVEITKKMSFDDKVNHPCIGEGRADLISAGCYILDQIFNQWSIDSLLVADRGLREGILNTLMFK